MASRKTSERIQQLFDKALDLEPKAREHLLQEAARDDLEVSQAVEKLLAAHSAAESSPAWEKNALETLAGSATSMAGSSLDHYRLLEQIGTGGMGLVYKAVREDDFSKLVAVKVLLAPEPAAVARFRHERQILAGLEHPNIARLLDGGTSRDGAPFLVMEYVEGRPLDRYVEEERLSTRDILTLIRKICDAIAYAHRKLIVHRDLKPGNILVTADGEPKVLDFGIARLMDGTALRTRTGPGAMTLEYASPEQVLGSAIGTATDVYSLGVIAYELLCGVRPYTNAGNPVELARSITEGAIQPARARNGGMLDADLRNILQTAMRVEPERRYAGPDQLAEDLRRYQQGYPVLARPNTISYRLVKFARRNWAATGAAILLAVATAAGIIATAREARIANRHFDEARRFANSYVFEVHDAIKDLPGATEARRIVIARALEYLDSVARERTNDRSLRRELAATYSRIADIQGRPVRNSFGDRQAALASLQKAIAILEPMAAGSPNDSALAEQLALTYEDANAVAINLGNLAQAADYSRKGIALMTRINAAHPGDAKADDALASVYVGLGDVSGNPSIPNLGDMKAALDCYGKAYDIWARLASQSPENADWLMRVAIATTRKAMMLEALAEYRGAADAYRSVLEIDERLLQRKPADTRLLSDTAVANRNLAKALLHVEETAEAGKLAARAMQLYQQIASADPNNFESQAALAYGHAIIGRVQAQANQSGSAARSFERAIAIFERAARERPQSLPPLELRNLYELMSEIALKDRSPGRALEFARKELDFGMRFLIANPLNVAAQRTQGVANRQLGLAREAIAMRGPRARRLAGLEEAQGFLQKAADVAASLQRKGQLAPVYQSDVHLASEALARVQQERQIGLSASSHRPGK
ncbi:MAG: protein kinase [Acidobacteria bacterium]|nr:protein kinase [Acidobacteriota bacterium]